MATDPMKAPDRGAPDDQAPRQTLARRMAAEMGERYVRLLAPPEGTSE